MTPEQIKNLIDQKIAGQGTMVDVGGALPTILKEIVDASNAPQPLLTFDVSYNGESDEIGVTAEQKAVIVSLVEDGTIKDYWAKYSRGAGSGGTAYAKVVYFDSLKIVVGNIYRNSAEVKVITLS